MSKKFLFANFHRSILKTSRKYANIRKCQVCFQLQQMSSSSSNHKKQISLDRNVTAKELAKKMNLSVPPLIELLEEYGYSTNKGVNTVLDQDIAEILADEFGFSVMNEITHSKDSFLPRPAVVTIMGHVDHGKTTLLDFLRHSSVAQQEAGGITQRIGAFSVKVPGLNERVTFVDTPGHAAFNSMRARGAKLTDIVVLVIAADDGIMEQTMECLRHIKEANVPMIIAINKIDKPKANTDKIKRELLSSGVQLEEYGGDVKCIHISALKGTNINDLLVLLNDFSKANNFSASFDVPVEAVVMEAESNKQKGIISSLLIKQGSLSKGKILIAGEALAKVRQLFDASGNILTKAGPSDPVQVLGWRSLPTPGDLAIEVKSESEARNILRLLAQDSKPVKEIRKPQKKAAGKTTIGEAFKGGRSKRIPYRVSLRADTSSGVNKEIVDETNKILNVIIKADVSGSLEAIVNTLSTFHSPDVKLNIMDASVGNISHNDLQMAETFQGRFTLGKDFTAKDKRKHSIAEEIESRLPLKIDESVIGEAEVLKVFKLTGSRKSIVAGCHVKDGLLDNSDKTYVWKVIRDGEVLHEGSIKSLMRGASDISSAKKYTECGITLNNYEQFIEGDRIVCVKVQRTKQTIEWKL